MAIQKLILLIIPIIISTHAQTLNQVNEQTCENVIKIDNIYYTLEKRINTTQTGIVYDMNIHWRTGKIFFAFSNKGVESLKILNPNGIIDTISVRYPTTIYVDNKHDDVYLGSQEGIYKYNMEDRSTVGYTARDTNVVSIVVTNDGVHMYYTLWGMNKVYKLTPVPHASHNEELFQAIPHGNKLVIDTTDNMYFVPRKTSFMLKNGDTAPTRIKDLPVDKMVTHFVSKSGQVYAMDVNSNLYLVDAENANGRLLGSFNLPEDVTTFAFDADDNVWIGIQGAILKFNKSANNPCTQNYV